MRETRSAVEKELQCSMELKSWMLYLGWIAEMYSAAPNRTNCSCDNGLLSLMPKKWVKNPGSRTLFARWTMVVRFDMM